jgi:metallopeptidase MepB
MVVHSAGSVEEAEKMDLAMIYNCIRREATGLCGPEVDGGDGGWGAGQARFEHVFQGYDAGYYSYAV